MAGSGLGGEAGTDESEERRTARDLEKEGESMGSVVMGKLNIKL
jgi:hypothetical protein